jgi:hypothetical protein
MPILDALDYPGMTFDTNAWGYQGGYQPSSAYGAQQQQQQGQQQQQQVAWQQQQQPAAAPQQAAPAADVFDLSAYEQQKGTGQGGY